MDERTWLYHVAVSVFLMFTSGLIAWVIVASFILWGAAAFLADGLIVWPVSLYFMWKAWRFGNEYERVHDLRKRGRRFPWSAIQDETKSSG